MNKGQTYECTNCIERFHICPDHIKAYKMPCPACDTCSLKPMDKKNYSFISAEKTAKNIYPKISNSGI